MAIFSVVERVLDNPWVDRGIRLLAVVALLVAIVVGVQRERQAECQNKYNEINNERIQALMVGAEFEREAFTARLKAEKELWLSPAIMQRRPGAPPNPEVVRLFARFQATLDAQARAADYTAQLRDDHPVLPPPSELCG